MKLRVITGFASAIVLAALVFFLPKWMLQGAIVLFMGLALYETFGILKRGGHAPVRWTGYGFAVLLLPAYWFMGVSGILCAMAAMMFCTVLTELWRKKASYQDLAFTAFAFFYPCLPFALCLPLRDFLPGTAGAALFILPMAVAFMGDVFAFLVGKRFGKHKLCPLISQKKTVEGALGGLAGSLLGGAAVYAIFGAIAPVWLLALLCVLGSAAAQVGDLTASLIKRYAGVKDYGTFFPGHGGVMDRLDSALMAVFVAYMLVYVCLPVA